MEPVIYCVLSCVALLSGVPHRELMRLPKAAVVAVDAAGLAAVFAKDASIPLLYFSAHDFDRAIRNLTPRDAAAVIEKRRAEWSPQALDQTSFWFYRRQRECLALAASAARAAQPALRSAVTGYFMDVIEVLARAMNAGRYDDTSIADLLVFALEKEAQLAAELQLAPNNSRFAQEIRDRMDFSKALAQALARLGRTEYAKAPLHVDVSRGVYIAPRNADLIGRLKADMQPWVAWRDGLVAPWRARDIPKLTRDGWRTEVLYLDSGEFLEEASESTQAQLDLRFNERAAAMSAPRTWDEYLNTLRLDALAFVHYLRSRARTAAPELNAQLDRTLTAHGQLLMRELQIEAPQTAAPVLDQLAAAEGEVVRGLALVLAWARQRGRNDLVERVLGWQTAKRAQLATLESLKPQRPKP